MRSSDHGIPSHPSNAFASKFLSRFEQQDEPPTGGEADAAGPWSVEPIPGIGFGLFRAGESLARGFRPAAVFPDRWLALLAAAVLPGTGRDPLLHLQKQADEEGYAVTLADGGLAGHFEVFDEALLGRMNGAVDLARSPRSLAYLLEAVGPLALERCGAILDLRVAEIRGA